MVVWSRPRLLLRNGHGDMLHCKSLLCSFSEAGGPPSEENSAVLTVHSRIQGHSQLPWWALIVALILSAAIFPFVIVVVSSAGPKCASFA